MLDPTGKRTDFGKDQCIPTTDCGEITYADDGYEFKGISVCACLKDMDGGIDENANYANSLED